MRKLLTRAAIILLLTLALLEVVLQVGAYVVWSQRGSASERSDGDGPVVLCVGDSMTYGLGATSTGAYPTQLQRILRERDPRPWVIINGGWPGSNTRDVITRLGDQLPRDAPDYVAVLIGTNNQWANSETLKTTADTDTFPLVWRTGRLLDIMLAGPLGDRPPRGFVGVWHRGAFDTEFEPTGRLVLAIGELRWVERDGQLIVVMPDETEHLVDWKLEDGKLHLSSAIWDEVQVLEPGRSPLRTPLENGKAALGKQDWTTAIAQFESVVTAAGEDLAEAREGLVIAYLATDRSEDANRQLEQLAAMDDMADVRPCDATIRGAHAHALLAVGQFGRAIDLAVTLVADHPADERGWGILIHTAPAHDATDKALAAIDAAVTSLPTDHQLRSQLLFQRALLVRHDDPEGFLRATVAAHRAGASDDVVVNLIRIGSDVVTDDLFARVTAGFDFAEVTKLRTLLERGLSADDELVGVLERHIEEILATCREAGATPILLDYPFPSTEHRQTVARVAARTDTPHVAIRTHFEQLLETTPKESLFVADNVHCTDRGYGEMADRVADVLLRIAR